MSCKAPRWCLTYESTFDFSPLSPFFCHPYLSHSKTCIKQLRRNMLAKHTHIHKNYKKKKSFLQKSCCWAHYYIFRLLITFQLLKQICYIECLISLLNSRWMWLWLEPASARYLSIKGKHGDGQENHALVATVCCLSCSTLVNSWTL